MPIKYKIEKANFSIQNDSSVSKLIEKINIYVNEFVL
jgi:hypothetical protein